MEEVSQKGMFYSGCLLMTFLLFLCFILFMPFLTPQVGPKQNFVVNDTHFYAQEQWNYHCRQSDSQKVEN